MKKPSIKQQSIKNNTKHRLSVSWMAFFASQKFYITTLVLFVIQATWIAVTAAYPMAFDEGFHYGIIRIYASQWSPILTHQPPDPGQYGELVHDPSYLYHYLMSFPYRLVMWLFNQYNIGVLTIRFIDIILFLVGLVLFRKLLVRFGISRALTNIILFIIVLVPITPFLAGQVNYDNLLFCLTPIFLWFALNITESIKTKHVIKLRDVAAFLCVGMAASLVKYAFLPIFVAGCAYVAFLWIKAIRQRRSLHSVTAIKRRVQIISILALVTMSGLFLQRYGYNAVVYHAIEPDCAKVLSVNDCLKYGPWARNYSLRQKAQTTHTNLSAPARNPLVYFRGWLHAMLFRLYFAINYDFTEYAPMSLPFVAVFVFGFSGLAFFAIFFRRIAREYTAFVWFSLVVITVYCISLFALNYSQYLEFGNVVAVNGRYLIPLLPLFLGMMGLGFRACIHRFNTRYVLGIKLALILLACLMTLDGGGVITYIIHSDPSWYWQDDIFTGFNMWVKNIASNVVLSGINQPIDHLLNDLLR